MNPKQLIRIYACKKDRSEKPLVHAVFHSSENFVISKEGGVLYPFGIGLYLERGIRLNQLNKQLAEKPVYSLKKIPFDVAGLYFPPPVSDLIHWEPSPSMRQSIYCLLLEAQEIHSATLEFPIDWAKKNYKSFTFSAQEWKPDPRNQSQLRWLIAWQLPLWNALKMTRAERFDHLTELANGHGLKSFNTLSTFSNHHSELKKL